MASSSLQCTGGKPQMVFKEITNFDKLCKKQCVLYIVDQIQWRIIEAQTG